MTCPAQRMGSSKARIRSMPEVGSAATRSPALMTRTGSLMSPVSALRVGGVDLHFDEPAGDGEVLDLQGEAGGAGLVDHERFGGWRRTERDRDECARGEVGVGEVLAVRAIPAGEVCGGRAGRVLKEDAHCVDVAVRQSGR